MRLRTAIARLNPQVPLAAREDALRQALDLGVSVQPSANRLLVSGALAQAQAQAETLCEAWT